MKIIKQYSLLFFILTALLISWMGWIPYAARESEIINLSIPAEIIWLAEFGPSLSALLFTYILFGRSGIIDLLSKLTKWKVGLGNYLLAIFTMPVLILFSMLISTLWSGTAYDLTLLRNWDVSFIERTEAFTPSMGFISWLIQIMKEGPWHTAIVFLLLAITNGGLSEEIGWRGFATKILVARGKNLITISLMIGLIWALWHTGTVFWKVIFTSSISDGLTFAISYLLQYLILVVPLSVFYHVLYVRSGRSLILPILFHAFYNICISIFASAFSNFPMITLVVLLWIMAILLIVLYNHKFAAMMNNEEGTLGNF